jgi:hypothetical protein
MGGVYLRCAECGADNKENAKFCEECGNPLDLKQPSNTNRNLIIVALILIIAIIGVYAVFQTTQKPALTLNNSTNNSSQSTSNSGSSSSSGSSAKTISASSAQSIASQYLASNPKYKNYEAGTPTLNGDVYLVPMVVANDNSQSPKGTVVGYITVDAKTGNVLGAG